MTEEFRQRSDLLGTQVITRSTGKRLGVVSQLWVDIDAQEVVALSLRPNLLYGTAQPMMLSSIRQIGDVILVDDEDVVEDVDLEGYSNLIGYEVITETGELLGKVRGFRFNIDTGKLDNLVIASIGLPLIPDQVVSTYELPITEIVSSGPDRLIVIEGSEDRMTQLSVGVLERLGIGKAPWEREQDQYLAPARPENQLPSGQPTQVDVRPRIQEPIVQVEETWETDEWEREPIPLRREQEPPRQQYREAEIYPPSSVYDDDEKENWEDSDDTNWGLSTRNDEPEYDDEAYDNTYVDEEDDAIAVEFEEVGSEASASPESFEPGNLDEDPWADAPEEDIPPQPLQELKIPDKPKQKQPEYEEEGY
ncbi:PRC-barrel domain-containing protein [Leptolyngbya sp. FACHB-17]|uniref:PRC-barrel domain-containing protein n=1 Tax=unclassified Leptolyngbya TaxID=2650499 RepID=UPI001680AC24|nr:PRC-barrel domain-containing protein [Leptolyngbya sp. FACHB-17]MBD2081668.1 PRC-barrel domain-containing protein [Leptolyngbya sp. FACHB-17]